MDRSKTEWFNEYGWISALDGDKVDILPLQFANCQRLRRHSAVYIFDEVGCGKTISSGLMALDYLYNHPNKKVLIITTTSLAKANILEPYGQFLKDWYTKLPFKQFHMENRIEIINQHYSNIEKKTKESYGLIIIDEAHLFLNPETLRYQNLIQLKGDKLLILTATPIKSGLKDLDTYTQIAKNIVGAEYVQEDWKKALYPQNNQLICNTFDLTSPVTRYFKDIFMGVHLEGYQKTKAKRLVPELWEYSGYSKEQALLDHIHAALEQNRESRFIVFVRYIQDEAWKIRDLFLQPKNGFEEYESATSPTAKTLQVISGANAYKLENCKGYSNLPTVAIITYQIAEQGVNMPGYNYVVNYHIPAYPSALEQRFGRIDRMGKKGSQFEDIHMSVLLSNRFDHDSINFYNAARIYITNMLSCIPAKNTILTKEFIDQFTNLQAAFSNEIKNLLQKESQLAALAQYLRQQAEYLKQCDETLLNFALEMEENTTDFASFKASIKEKLKQAKDSAQRLETSNPQGASYLYQTAEYIESLIQGNHALTNVYEYLQHQHHGEKFHGPLLYFVQAQNVELENLSVEGLKKLLEAQKGLLIDNNILSSLKDTLLGDKIFYMNQQSDGFDQQHPLQVISAKECAHAIKQSLSFQQYQQSFEKIAQRVTALQQIRHKLNRYFEYQFSHNRLEQVFPYLGYEDLIQTEMEKEQEYIQQFCKERQIDLETFWKWQQQIDQWQLVEEIEKGIARLNKVKNYYSTQQYVCEYVESFQEKRRKEIAQKKASLPSLDKSLIWCLSISKEEFALVQSNLQQIISSLPFFQMCQHFKEILQGYLYTAAGTMRKQYDSIIFVVHEGMESFIRRNALEIGLSENFMIQNWYLVYEQLSGVCWCAEPPLYTIHQHKQPDCDTITVELSNWYKLLYHYCRKEECYIENGVVTYQEGNPYHKNEQIMLEAARVFKLQGYDETAFNTLIQQNNINLSLEKPTPIGRFCKYSLLQAFFFNRNYEQNCFIYKDHYKTSLKALESIYPQTIFQPADIWTRGFYSEVLQLQCPMVAWSDILKLPKALQHYSIYNDGTSCQNPME